ncbi:rRNA maturation RNase YbeY, partial [Desulfovibrio sp. OttesenSCG-928-A18]|nr:rRNA maturation RNase YbeY [Desulfovibrio sp. OttesenSCG-928-A18]
MTVFSQPPYDAHDAEAEQAVLILRAKSSPCWKLPFARPELGALVTAMLRPTAHAHARLELSILDDAAMAELHAQSLGLSGPTNVLSFPARDDSRTRPAPQKAGAYAPPESHRESSPFLGWMALCADALARECFLYGQDPEEHCIRLLAHGLAHLLGHEHGPEMDRLCGELEA